MPNTPREKCQSDCSHCKEVNTNKFMDYERHECGCHTPSPIGEYAGEELYCTRAPSPKVNYNHISHTHCWENTNLPCGIPLHKHKQCCLCDLKVPSPKGEEWVEQFDNVLHTDEIYFDEDLQNDGFFPSKEKILAFIRELLSEEKKKSYMEGRAEMVNECLLEHPSPNQVIAAYKADIEKKIEGMERKVIATDFDLALNAALSELKSKL